VIMLPRCYRVSLHQAQQYLVADHDCAVPEAYSCACGPWLSGLSSPWMTPSRARCHVGGCGGSTMLQASSRSKRHTDTNRAAAAAHSEAPDPKDKPEGRLYSVKTGVADSQTMSSQIKTLAC
jgi:hypothetical protein